jgi:lysine 2,3-aminomutase
MIDREVIARYSELVKRDRLLPVRVTPHYRRLIEEEITALGNTTGPLYKVAYPTYERIAVRAEGEVKDFVYDEENMPQGLKDIVIRKYNNRLLFLITDQCAGHCMYCFRQDVLSNQHVRELPSFDTKISALIEYVQDNPVEELILSGGDPTNVPLKQLEITLRRLRQETRISHIRLHTRNAVYAPHVFREHLCRLFAEYDVRVVLHIVHPYELVEETIKVIKKMCSFGVRCYSQFPILRGVNDHALVLERLLSQFDDLRVRPLSMFIADPINYSASFRLPLARLFSIIDDLNHHTSSWINSVRLVLDTPIGKVRREDMIYWDKEQNFVIFSRDDKQITYYDFPKELDVLGEINILLWKS